ncbi:MAG: hypothetical protein EA423_00110 [Phycisphaerales bacterium]|nr:MAG: hypothetical protein EA423_00110 [Phycisphaerales bacterium]
MTKNQTAKMLTLSVVLAGVAGTASAQRFSDNFNSGSLDAWGAPNLFGEITSHLVSAATGELRMEGVGISTVRPDFIYLPLAASVADIHLYQNGSASVDLDLDGGSQGGIVARGDYPRAAVEFGVLNRANPLSNDRLFINIGINGVLVAGNIIDLNFEASSVRLDASWNGAEYKLTATDRLTLESMSVGLTGPSFTGGGEVGLAVARSVINVFDFGATFDNFEISPACPPDLNNDGVVDADDFFLFLNLFSQGDPRADFNGDGVIDADDFFAFLSDFAAGC